MITDRIGNWAWALTPAERLVSVSVSTAQREGAVIGPRLARRYEVMRIKQAKLLARGFQPGGPHGFGQAQRRGTAGSAPPNAFTVDAAIPDSGTELRSEGGDETAD
jgi:hypothetical protein